PRPSRQRIRQLKWLQYSGIGTVWALFVLSCLVGGWVGSIPWWSAVCLVALATLLLDRVTRAVMVQTGPVKVPVLMYHSVAPEFDLVPAPGLSVRPEVFSAHLQLFREEGYTTHTLSELRAHLTGEEQLHGKPLVITFDDGYLDNYLHAFPLLRRYNAKATIFVAADFVEDTRTLRKQPSADDQIHGAYLGWPEIREMVESGLVEIESHAATHDLLPRADRVVDFYRPGLRFPWLAWRLFPKEKPRWFLRRPDEIGYGRPIYESGSALEGPCFKPDREVEERLMARVREGGGKPFFRRIGWREELERVVEEYRFEHEGGTGRFETDEEWRERVREELVGSRVRLSRGIGRQVRFLAWPYDRFNEKIEAIAIGEAGYEATTSGIHQNEPGDDARGISRIPAGEAMLGRPWRRGDLWLLRANLALFRGNYLYYLPAFFANRIRDLVMRVSPPHDLPR
ncbi:MAG: hypothetical protein CME06_06680, partial [Gemmatimonadetes bacterium]|nr:hypothetical protein [Gemmatimonadota bacterium]